LLTRSLHNLLHNRTGALRGRQAADASSATKSHSFWRRSRYRHSGLFKVLVEKLSGRILGAQVPGSHADAVINLFAIAIRINTARDRDHRPSDSAKNCIKGIAVLYRSTTNFMKSWEVIWRLASREPIMKSFRLRSSWPLGAATAVLQGLLSCENRRNRVALSHRSHERLHDVSGLCHERRSPWGHYPFRGARAQ
jgi:hypothetical protein